jgi:hypothetical protein
MIPVSSIDINFEVLEHDLKSILIRPYSNLFKNPISTYPAFRLNLNTLNNESDIHAQIGLAIKGTIVNIVNYENTPPSVTIDNILNGNIDNKINVSLDKINELEAKIIPQVSNINFVS